MGQANYRNGFKLTCHPELLDLPLRWRKPQEVFVNSMSDLFHADVTPGFIQSVFTTMRQAERHVFQILTKRASRMAELSHQLDWTENIWMGVTVESKACKDRIDNLHSTGARVKFLSLEPLLESIGDLDLTGVDWVIVGGESGPGARPMQVEWVRSIRDQCLAQHVPFFFKQWGGFNKKKAGRVLDGRTWDQLPRTTRALAAP
jgi:protein gp37